MKELSFARATCVFPRLLCLPPGGYRSEGEGGILDFVVFFYGEGRLNGEGVRATGCWRGVRVALDQLLLSIFDFRRFARFALAAQRRRRLQILERFFDFWEVYW
jgi:hypothetical protein